METICINCQILFSGKIRKIFINLLSAEFAQGVVKVYRSKICHTVSTATHIKDRFKVMLFKMFIFL